MFDIIFFGVFPYVAAALAIAVSIYRYKSDRFSYSSLSSQFLEGKKLFWGSVPWHYGILIILLAHLLAFLFPGFWSRLIGHPTRLYILEITGLSLSLAALVGILALTIRRIWTSTVRSVTSVMDAVLLAVLIGQVGLGLYTALFFRWGSDWYLHTAVPWLWSLVMFSPKLEYVTALPLVVRLHIIGGFLVLALFPFTRMVHLITVPFGYLWRPYQVVIWYRQAHAYRRADKGRVAVPLAQRARVAGRPLATQGVDSQAGVSVPK